MKHYLDTSTCDMVLLGGLHLASRAAALGELNAESRSKITLVRTVSMAKAFEELNLSVTNVLEGQDLFGGVLGVGGGAEQQRKEVEVAEGKSAGSQKKSRVKKEKGKEKKVGKKAQEEMLVPASVKLGSRIKPALESSGQGSQVRPWILSYTHRGYVDVLLALQTSSSTTDSRQLHLSDLLSASPSPSPLEPPSPSFKSAIKPCQDFYLSPSGCYRRQCTFSHAYPFSDAEWQAYPAYVKSLVCKQMATKGSCPFGDECYFGHACPFEVS